MKKIEQIDQELKRNAYFLNERVKEQRCLLAIARLTTEADIPIKAIFEQVISFLIPAWQYPEYTYARIVFHNLDLRSPNYSQTPAVLVHSIRVKGADAGRIEVGYADGYPVNGGDPFLDEERCLLEAVAELVESILEKKRQEILIRKASKRLKEKSEELQRKNYALREILSQIEQEKTEIKDQINTSIRKFILPLIQNLKNENLSVESRGRYLELLESNIRNISSSTTRKLADKKLNLSPREAEICNLIKNGLQTKEISEMLKLSILTVERHRFNIRKKLELNNTQVNLQTFLQEP